METQFCRTELLIGADSMEKLSGSRVAVFGIGGVGGFAAEALVRAGIGAIDIIDDDTVSISNLNRQIIALQSTVGMYKVDVAEARFRDINPDIRVVKHKTFFMPETADEFDFSFYDYVIDAIDTVTGKICIVKKCTEAEVPVISSMGTGNKMDPLQLEVTDINKTSVCPLAKVMRHELRKQGIRKLKVVYSKEIPLKPSENASEECIEACLGQPSQPDQKRSKRAPGSISFVPSVAGLIIAGEVIKDIIGMNH